VPRVNSPGMCLCSLPGLWLCTLRVPVPELCSCPCIVHAYVLYRPCLNVYCTYSTLSLYRGVSMYSYFSHTVYSPRWQFAYLEYSSHFIPKMLLSKNLNFKCTFFC
jgi:hypothetical protein